MGDFLWATLILIIGLGMTSWKHMSLFPTATLTPTPTIRIVATNTPGPSPTGPTRTPTPTPTKIPTTTPTPSISPLRTTLSGSKLGVFYLAPSTGGTLILRSAPRVIKVADPQNNPDLMQYIRDYKRMFPNGIVVMRVIDGSRNINFTTADSPIIDAQTYWNQVLQPAINKLSPADKALIDYQSGPNEFENMPFFINFPDFTPQVGNTQWINTFWLTLADLISNNGFKPMLGDIQVGHPSDFSLLQYLFPSLRRIRDLGGAWSYHSYTENYSTDPNSSDATVFSLRYRQFYTYFSSNAPDLMSLPLILTEGGVAESGNPQGGYRISGRTADYENWLTWFDSQIRNDSYVLGGVTLFQIGDDGTWYNFNLEPINGWMSTYLINH